MSIELGKYQHYKGNFYEVIGVVKHSETLEELVLYKQLYSDGALWVRPLSMFLETINVDGVTKSRFEKV